MDKEEAETSAKPKNSNEPRESTHRAFAEIMQTERKARLAKTSRLRSLRVSWTSGEQSP